MACSILASEVRTGCWGNWEASQCRTGRAERHEKGWCVAGIGSSLVWQKHKVRYILRFQERWSQGQAGVSPRKALNATYSGVGIFFICQCYHPVHAESLLEEQINEAADHAKQKLVKNVKEKQLNVENWLHKWWKLNRGCCGHLGINKRKKPLLPPAGGTQRGGSVTEAKGPGPSTGNRITTGQPCGNQSYGETVEALPRGEREGEEYSGFCLPPALCQCLPLAKPGQRSEDSGVWKHSLQEWALQGEAEGWSSGHVCPAWLGLMIHNVGRCYYD